MKRYLILLLNLARYSYVASLEYRFQYVVRVLRIIVEFGLTFLFINTFYQKTAVIGNWSKYEMLLLDGIFTIVFSSVFMFINGNLQELADEKIINGQLDGILVKPVDSQFLISFERMHIQNLWRIGGGILLAMYAWSKINITIGYVEILTFVVTLISGMVIQYSVLFIISVLSFWTYTTEPEIMTETALSIAHYPLDIFSKKAVRWLTIIPIIFISTVPTRALLGRFDILTWISPVAAVAVLLLSRRFFHFALRHYSSASS
mgnify:CR=1 FL=1